MAAPQESNESAARLEHLVQLIDDLERLKRDPVARRRVLERLNQEIQASKQAPRPYPPN